MEQHNIGTIHVNYTKNIGKTKNKYIITAKQVKKWCMVWYGNCLFDKIKSTLKHNSKYVISES